jgi:hypothetical protein
MEDALGMILQVRAGSQRHTRESFWTLVQRCAHGWDCTTCCWPWLGRRRQRQHANYGLIKVRVETANGPKYKLENASRLALMIHHDAGILPGIEALHTCDNPPCCNYHHLFAGTQLDNIKDMERKGRRVTRIGEANTASKLTEPEVRELRQLRAAGWKLIDLANRYGVGTSAVYAADQYLTWKEVV